MVGPIPGRVTADALQRLDATNANVEVLAAKLLNSLWCTGRWSALVRDAELAPD